MAGKNWLWRLRQAFGISASPAHYVGVGDAAVMRGDLGVAIRAYSIAIELDPQCWDAYEKRGMVHANRGEFDKALADLDVAVSRADDPTAAYLNRALAYEQMGRTERALADYASAIQRTQDYWPAYYNRAVLSARRGDHQQGAADLRRCEELGLPAEQVAELRQELRSHGLSV